MTTSNRTANRSLGLLGSAVFLLAGLLFAYVMVLGMVHDDRVRTAYDEAQCKVLAKHAASGKNPPAALFDVSFTVNGTTRTVTGVPLYSRALADHIVPKATTPCFYDPDNPQAVALDRGSPLGWGVLMLLFPGLFVVIGLGGVLSEAHSFGKSPEAILAEQTMVRAHATAARAHRERAGPYRGSRAGRPTEDLEGLPLKKVVTLPGAKLPVRLLRDQARVAQLGALGVFAILWNGITGIALVGMLGAKQVVGVLFLAPFLIVGVGMLVAVVKRVLLFAVREPIVEISAHPLRSGSTARLSITQRGPLHATMISVALRGVESATSHGSKSSSTRTARFLDKDLVDDVDVRIGRGEVWTKEVDIAIPVDSPSSFASRSNELGYSIVVKAVIPNFPDDENAFPFLVLPMGDDDA